MKAKFLFTVALSLASLPALAQCPAESWWSNFNDSTLDSLIYLGQNNNLHLAQAMRRI